MNKENTFYLRNKALHFFRSDREGVLPIHLYRPDDLRSESREYFQATLCPREAFSQKQSVLVIAAHQDDETEFFGATIAKLSQKGYPVTVVHMTDGRYGADRNFQRQDLSRLVKTRLEESLAAAKELGVYKVINLGLKDTFVHSQDETTIKKLVSIARQENASIIVSQANSNNPTTSDGHPDHMNTFPLVATAVFRASLHLYQPTRREKDPIAKPTLYTWDPQSLQNIYGEIAPVEMIIDATDTQEIKQRAFAKYITQIGNRADGGSYVADRIAQDRMRGGRIFPFAEGLTQYKPAQFNSRNILKDFLGEDVQLTKE